MGLIKAGVGSLGGVLADQWKEFFTCSALPKEVLVRKGEKKYSGRSSNTKGEDNVISNGSGLVVADGQCAIITDQGKVAEICAVPGEYTYDASTEPSIFAGSFGESLKQTFMNIGKRFTYGGVAPRDQRVYYFNTKEILDNKFGTPNPILFRIVDNKIGLDMETELRCNGVYSYKLTDPILFYTNVCGNIDGDYTRAEIDGQLKAEFVDALGIAMGSLSALELRPSQIPSHTAELKDAMNAALNAKWSELRGISVSSIAMNPITMNEEDAEYLKRYQRGAATARMPGMGAGVLLESQADAMKAAGANQGGAMGGFVGMGMAMNAGGMNAQQLFNMQGAQPQQQPAAPAQPATGAWTCPQCGKQATGKFCPECGTKKPEADGWTCPQCGASNKGRFCAECGTKKPEGAPLYKCDKCGWEPEDPAHPPKFCPECGDIFDDNDRQ